MKTNTAVTTKTEVSAATCYLLADSETWSQPLAEVLTESNVKVEPFTELHDLFEESRDRPPGLLVIAQPNATFAVRACRVIRGLQDVPMIVLMQRESELIPVLDAGADDAVVSRTSPDVFAARVRALLRRSKNPAPSGGTLQVRDLVIDMEKYQVTLRGEVINLTPTEFKLLAVLAQQAGRVTDARALLSAVHQHDYGEKDAQNLVKVHIANLRRKMNDQKSDSPYILCVRGFGYMLERRSRTREGDPLSNLLENE